MPLSKNDNPESFKPDTFTEASDASTDAAVEAAIDSGAGAPDSMTQAAEALPEGDPVKDATKKAMLATDAQTEAQEKAKVVEDSSTGSETTPSGTALLETAGIADDIERGEEYNRIKSAVRHGYVPATEADTKTSKTTKSAKK